MNVDLVLVGGGLANSILAYRLAEARPDLELLLLEQSQALGGEHVWSFHGSDLTPAQRGWIEPLVECSWQGYEVRFPGFSRSLGGSYHSLTSSRLDRKVRAKLGDRVQVGTRVIEVSEKQVTTADGAVIRARTVIDGRGFGPGSGLTLAYQKFVGLHVELEESAGLARPILMDATVEQFADYRFVYTLPFEPTRLLIEDTRYSDTPDLDTAEMRDQITAYARGRGWRIRSIHREESGVLPIVLAGDLDAFWATGANGAARSGMRAALFHPTTGYSLPEAVHLADDLATDADIRTEALDRRIRRRSRALWRRGRYFRFLNRMLFRAAEPSSRYRVLRRFYSLPEPLIERFYAGRLSFMDRLRIVSGKPPVPIGKAMACLIPDGTVR